MTTQPPPTDTSECAGADILLRTALGMTAVLALAFLIIVVSAPGPDELISDGQIFGTLVGLLAITIGVPCWIAVGLRTIIRALRH
jgi:hypothetical protein